MTHIERIGKLEGPLTIECYVCQHTVIWTKDQAVEWLGGWRQPYDARVVLRCTKCGVKGSVNFG